MPKRKFQYWLIQILLILTIIWVSTKISFLFQPIGIFFSTIFFPILITGFLYFLLNPVVDFLQRRKVPRLLSIIIIYVVFIAPLCICDWKFSTCDYETIYGTSKRTTVYADKTMKFFDSIAKSSEFKWIMDEQKDILETVQAKTD